MKIIIIIKFDKVTSTQKCEEKLENFQTRRNANVLYNAKFSSQSNVQKYPL